MESFIARDTRVLILVFAAGIFLIAPQAGFGATKYAAHNGSSSNSGNQAGSPWDAQSCLSRLSPGDTCIYLAGNYNDTRFKPSNNGTSSAWITHRCEKLHACRFDQLKFDGNQFLNIVNIASDSNFYDPSKSYSNPRMLVRDSHDLRFDSIYVRGEPQVCAQGNPGPGCRRPSEFSRYNDLVTIGDSNFPSAVSYRIEISGASEFINGNHSVIVFFDDGDTQFCETDESNIWIHGTPEMPIRMSSKYHHNLEFKGACRVLVEYVDFGQAGNGRGDLMQPANGHIWQSGGSIHGSTIQNTIIRYSNFTRGGSATNEHKNQAHYEVGMFGRGVNGACFPHNSHFRPWGPLAIFGLINGVPHVRNVSVLNNAVAQGWYMAATNRSVTTSPYAGYLLVRTGLEGNVEVDVDGLAVDSASAQDGLLFGRLGATFAFQNAPFQSDGINVGSKMFNNLSDLFRNPANGDFRPTLGSRLVGTAIPIARTTASGNGTTIPVDRPECFAGTLGGMRKGDSVIVGDASCTVVNTNLSKGTLTCSNSIAWSSGDEVYYSNDDGVMRDIGSRSPQSGFAGSPLDGKRPNPPSLVVE